MRQLKILFFAFFLVTTVHAQESVVFRDLDFPELLRLAKTENKPIMLMCYADWCPHCNKMKTEVLTNPEVAAFFNANFLAISKDMENGDGIALRKKFSVRSYPTFIFFNPDGEVIYRFTNELKAPEFIKEGQNALDPEKQLPNLKKKFLADITNGDNCLTYVYALRRAGMDAGAVARQYLATQTEEQLVSATNWKIIANAISEIDSREIQHILKNQQQYAAVSSPLRVERKILNVVKETLQPFAEAGDTLNYLKARPAVAAINLRKSDSLIFTYDLKLYEMANNWTGYKKTALQSAQKFAWDNPSLLRDLATTFEKYVSDEPAIEQSIVWAERSLELKTAYDIYLVLANLNLKIGKKDLARHWAEQGRDMAAAHNFDTSRAEEILKRI